MSKLKVTEPLFTIEEIMQLTEHTTLTKTYIAKDIYTEYERKYEREYKDTRNSYDHYGMFLLAIGTIFDAGRIQGIREERARKKAVQTLSIPGAEQVKNA